MVYFWVVGLFFCRQNVCAFPTVLWSHQTTQHFQNLTMFFFVPKLITFPCSCPLWADSRHFCEMSIQGMFCISLQFYGKLRNPLLVDGKTFFCCCFCRSTRPRNTSNCSHGCIFLSKSLIPCLVVPIPSCRTSFDSG